VDSLQMNPLHRKPAFMCSSRHDVMVVMENPESLVRYSGNSVAKGKQQVPINVVLCLQACKSCRSGLLHGAVRGGAAVQRARPARRPGDEIYDNEDQDQGNCGL